MHRRGGEPGIHCIAVQTGFPGIPWAPFFTVLSRITHGWMTLYLVKSAYKAIVVFNGDGLALKLLGSILRFSSARYAPAVTKEQKQAIHAIYSGSDVFVWLPTEFGKSVCLKTLPFVFDFKLA